MHSSTFTHSFNGIGQLLFTKYVIKCAIDGLFLYFNQWKNQNIKQPLEIRRSMGSKVKLYNLNYYMFNLKQEKKNSERITT